MKTHGRLNVAEILEVLELMKDHELVDVFLLPLHEALSALIRALFDVFDNHARRLKETVELLKTV